MHRPLQMCLIQLFLTSRTNPDAGIRAGNEHICQRVVTDEAPNITGILTGEPSKLSFIYVTNFLVSFPDRTDLRIC